MIFEKSLIYNLIYGFMTDTSFSIESEDLPAELIEVKMQIREDGQKFMPSGITIDEIIGCLRWEMLAYVEQEGFDNIEEWIICEYDELMADIANEDGPELYEAAKSAHADQEYHRRKEDPSYPRY